MKHLLLISVGALLVLLAMGWELHAQGMSAVDHYKCYKVKGKAVEPTPTPIVNDEFEKDVDTVSKPALVCNPAIKIIDDKGSLVSHPTVHQVCYKVKGQNKLPQVTVRVKNQFGADQILEVNTKEKLLCVPSTKTCLDDLDLPTRCPNEPTLED